MSGDLRDMALWMVLALAVASVAVSPLVGSLAVVRVLGPMLGFCAGGIAVVIVASMVIDLWPERRERSGR